MVQEQGVLYFEIMYLSLSQKPLIKEIKENS